MPDIAKEKCFHHPAREAAARCPLCRQYYCRECVTEHDDRLVCAACLREASSGKRSFSRWSRDAALLAPAVLSFLVLWILFHVIGWSLLLVPGEGHEQALWQTEPDKVQNILDEIDDEE